MPSEPQPHSKEESSERKPLPFEPAKSRKKSTPDRAVAASATQKTSPARVATHAEASIPEIVSKRMVRRMALFSGIPTALGISTFFVSYWIMSHGWFKLPHVAVLLTSVGFFGLGVLGLSYGVLSASWDETTVGSKVGWTEFTTNFGRMTAAWRSAGQKNSS